MTPETRQQIEALLRAGHSDTEVYRQTGVARTTVARHRARLGLPGYRATADSPTCRHSHPFPENLARNGLGHIFCRECKRQSDHQQHLRRYQPVPPPEPDEVAIERAVAGDPPERLTTRERYAAIAQLDARQMSATAIAEHVGCCRRTVTRARSRRAAA